MGLGEFDVRLEVTRAGIRARAMIAASALALILAAGPAQARWFFESAPAPAAKAGNKSRATLPAQPGALEQGPLRRGNKSKKTTAIAPKTVEKLPPGPLTVVVSIKKQRLTVYANGQPVAHSPVSTGVPGHPTPQGVFSIIQKNLHHRSNIYSGAPMPYMQRITWSGVAMHEGKLPGYPASHGCIRLPREFAQRLWGMTRIGARVIITQDEVLPSNIVHDRLLALHGAQTTVGEVEQPAKVRYATAATPTLDVPLKGALDESEESRIQKAIDSAVQNGLAEAEIHIQNSAQGGAQAVEPGLQGDPDKGRVAGNMKDPVLRPGPISIFVSRKTGKLYVRKGFEEVLETSVTIARPNDAIGTHVFTALKDGDEKLRWNVVSLPTDRLVKKGRYQMTMHRGEKLRKVLAAPVHEEVAPGDPRAALDRITIPDATLAKLNDLMTPGASFIISDLGQSFETGKGTDFILLTR